MVAAATGRSKSGALQRLVLDMGDGAEETPAEDQLTTVAQNRGISSNGMKERSLRRALDNKSTGGSGSAAEAASIHRFHLGPTTGPSLALMMPKLALLDLGGTSLTGAHCLQALALPKLTTATLDLHQADEGAVCTLAQLAAYTNLTHLRLLRLTPPKRDPAKKKDKKTPAPWLQLPSTLQGLELEFEAGLDTLKAQQGGSSLLFKPGAFPGLLSLAVSGGAGDCTSWGAAEVVALSKACPRLETLSLGDLQASPAPANDLVLSTSAYTSLSGLTGLTGLSVRVDWDEWGVGPDAFMWTMAELSGGVAPAAVGPAAVCATPLGMRLKTLCLGSKRGHVSWWGGEIDICAQNFPALEDLRLPDLKLGCDDSEDVTSEALDGLAGLASLRTLAVGSIGKLPAEAKRMTWGVQQLCLCQRQFTFDLRTLAALPLRDSKGLRTTELHMEQPFDLRAHFEQGEVLKDPRAPCCYLPSLLTSALDNLGEGSPAMNALETLTIASDFIGKMNAVGALVLQGLADEVTAGRLPPTLKTLSFSRVHLLPCFWPELARLSCSGPGLAKTIMVDGACTGAKLDDKEVFGAMVAMVKEKGPREGPVTLHIKDKGLGEGRIKGLLDMVAMTEGGRWLNVQLH